MAISLDAAVEAGTISEYAAFGGMQRSDLEPLIPEGFGGLQVLVHGHYGRQVLSVYPFHETEREVYGRLGGTRDEAAVALNVESTTSRKL